MTIDQIKKNKLRPLRDLVAFTWLKPQLKSNILIPDSYYNLGLQEGKFYIGKVIAIGSKVEGVKLRNRILIQEYGIKDFRGTWKENEIYFIEEPFIKARVDESKDFVQRITFQGEVA